MRDYGRVHSTFWSSPTIAAMSDDGKMLALYLMTCSHNTISGVFRLPDGYASEDLKWSAERVREGFAELSANGFANRCETTKWVWVIKHLEWNPPENPNQTKAAAKAAAQVPAECGWKQAFLRLRGALLGFGDEFEEKGCETVAEPFRNQEQEQEQEQELAAAKRPARRPSKRCPDTFVVTDELREWARAKAPGIDIERETESFRDWTFKDAKTDWAATWRTWMRKAAEGGLKGRTYPAQGDPFAGAH